MTGLFSTHVLSLDALLTVLESVEDHCHTRIMAAKNSKCVIVFQHLLIITYLNDMYRIVVTKGDRHRVNEEAESVFTVLYDVELLTFMKVL